MKLSLKINTLTMSICLIYIILAVKIIKLLPSVINGDLIQIGIMGIHIAICLYMIKTLQMVILDMKNNKQIPTIVAAILVLAGVGIFLLLIVMVIVAIVILMHNKEMKIKYQ